MAHDAVVELDNAVVEVGGHLHLQGPEITNSFVQASLGLRMLQSAGTCFAVETGNLTFVAVSPSTGPCLKRSRIQRWFASFSACVFDSFDATQVCVWPAR